MEMTQVIPVALFVGTIGAVLFLRYRVYASLTREERLAMIEESARKAKERVGGRIPSWPERINETMPAIVTIIILAASVYIILSPNFGDDKAKWAFGSVGIILGYWLRPGVKPGVGPSSG